MITQHFPLEPRNGFVTLMTRFLIVLAVVGWWVILLLYLAGAAPADTSVLVALFLFASAVLVPWNIRRSRRGAAEIYADRLLVRTPGVTHSYPWQHIRKVEVVTIRDTGALNRAMYQAFGIDVDQRIVRVRLRRSLRQGLISSRLGTDFIGLPAPGAKLVDLFLQDPDAFAAAVIPYLQAAGSYDA